MSVKGRGSDSQDLVGHFCMILIISSGVMCWKSENLCNVMKAVVSMFRGCWLEALHDLVNYCDKEFVEIVSR